jgi:hypothetical protein
MKPTAGADRLAAQRQVHRALAVRITELADGGLSDFEIQALTGVALPLIRLVLRGAIPGVVK